MDLLTFIVMFWGLLGFALLIISVENGWLDETKSKKLRVTIMFLSGPFVWPLLLIRLVNITVDYIESLFKNK